MEKGTYTYRQILLGLRNEYLEIQKKLDQLKEFLIVSEEDIHNYYFNLFKNYLVKSLPELTIERNIKRNLFHQLGIKQAPPTRTFVVKDNNNNYYPLRRPGFDKDDFAVTINIDRSQEFHELVQDILNSDFAQFMSFTDNIFALDAEGNSLVKPKIVPRSFKIELLSHKSIIEYLGRMDILRFASVKEPTEQWEPLTQQYLDYISNVEFPRESFSSYHQSIIEKTIDDERPLVLADDYKTSILANFDIQEEPKRLVLSNTEKRDK